MDSNAKRSWSHLADENNQTRLNSARNISKSTWNKSKGNGEINEIQTYKKNSKRLLIGKSPKTSTQALVNTAAKLMMSIDALANAKENVYTQGCDRYLVIVQTKNRIGVAAGAQYFIKFHGKTASSQFIQLEHSESNKAKFFGNQKDAFTVVFKSVGEVEAITIGFSNSRSVIGWEIGLIQVIDIEKGDYAKVYPVDKLLEGTENYITVRRQDLVLNEERLAMMLAAKKIELIKDAKCIRVPKQWSQYGGCQMEILSSGRCLTTRRSQSEVYSGICQEITNQIYWSHRYRIIADFKITSDEEAGEGTGEVQIIFLYKQLDQLQFVEDVLATKSCYQKSKQLSIDCQFQPDMFLFRKNTEFQKAYLCFTSNAHSVFSVQILNVQMLNSTNHQLLNNANFLSYNKSIDGWRGTAFAEIKRIKFEDDFDGVATVVRPYLCSGIACDVSKQLCPGKRYELSCQVWLIENKSQVANVSISCFLSYPSYNDDTDDVDNDINQSIAFTGEATERKWMPLKGEMRVPDKFGTYLVIEFTCDNQLCHFCISKVCLTELED